MLWFSSGAVSYTHLIRKCLTTKTIAQCAAFFVYCLLPLKGICQTGESTVNALVKMGFENVGWTEDCNERVYVLQNSAYRCLVYTSVRSPHLLWIGRKCIVQQLKGY